MRRIEAFFFILGMQGPQSSYPLSSLSNHPSHPPPHLFLPQLQADGQEKRVRGSNGRQPFLFLLLVGSWGGWGECGRDEKQQPPPHVASQAWARHHRQAPSQGCSRQGRKHSRHVGAQWATGRGRRVDRTVPLLWTSQTIGAAAQLAR